MEPADQMESQPECNILALEEQQLVACKHCHTCNMIKPLGDFQPDATMADGYSSVCGSCALGGQQLGHHGTASTSAEIPILPVPIILPVPKLEAQPPGAPTTQPPSEVAAPPQPLATKECPRCHSVKATTEYFRNRARSDGLFAICKACFHARQEEKKKKAVEDEAAGVFTQQGRGRKRKALNNGAGVPEEGEAAGLRRSVRAREHPGVSAAEMLAAIDLMLHMGNGHVENDYCAGKHVGAGKNGIGDGGDHAHDQVNGQGLRQGSMTGSGTTQTDDGHKYHHEGEQGGGDVEDEVPVKVCKACGKFLAASKFYAAGKSGNQLSTNCRICTSRKNRERARVRERTVASIIPPTKVCRSCKLEKPSDRYYRNMGAYDGLFARCKDCSMLQRVAKYVEEPTVTHKVCRKCHIDKPASEFARNRSIRDGLYSWCRACDALKSQSRMHNDNQQLTAAFKECGQCRKEMAARHFLKDDSTVDGLSKRCRACMGVAKTPKAARKQAAREQASPPARDTLPLPVPLPAPPTAALPAPPTAAEPQQVAAASPLAADADHHLTQEAAAALELLLAATGWK